MSTLPRCLQRDRPTWLVDKDWQLDGCINSLRVYWRHTTPSTRTYVHTVRTTWRFSRHVLSVLFWRKINTIARLSASSLLSSAIDAFARWPTAEEKWQRMKITAQLADLSIATWLARHIPAGRGNESVPKIVIDNKTNLFSNTPIRILLISDTVSECWMIKSLPYILFEKYIYILALEMTSAGNSIWASCIGTL